MRINELAEYRRILSEEPVGQTFNDIKYKRIGLLLCNEIEQMRKTAVLQLLEWGWSLRTPDDLFNLIPDSANKTFDVISIRFGLWHRGYTLSNDGLQKAIDEVIDLPL